MQMNIDHELLYIETFYDVSCHNLYFRTDETLYCVRIVMRIFN